MRRHYANTEHRVKNYINTTKVILSVVIDGFKIFVSEGRESETFLLTLKSFPD